MRALYLLSVWLHVLAAVAWIGGMVFLVLVLVPVLRGRPFGAIQTQLLYRIGLQLRRVGWVALGLLIITGVTNLWLRGIPPVELFNPALYQGGFGSALLAKLALVAVVLAISAIHDFRVGPRAIALMEADPAGAAARSMRRRARWMGRLTFVLSLVILWLATTLPRGGL
jgi:copper resistance protein D